jgi:hypothetical protein
MIWYKVANYTSEPVVLWYRDDNISRCIACSLPAAESKKKPGVGDYPVSEQDLKLLKLDKKTAAMFKNGELKTKRVDIEDK